MRRLLISVVITVLTFIFASPAALAFNQRINVYASVPPMRAVYVDDAGDLIKIAGNTSQNIEPTVYDQQNKQVQMTESIKSQYEQFLKSHDYKLEASKIYDINPVSVSILPNTETITVSASPDHLSLSF